MARRCSFQVLTVLIIIGVKVLGNRSICQYYNYGRCCSAIPVARCCRVSQPYCSYDLTQSVYSYPMPQSWSPCYNSRCWPLSYQPALYEECCNNERDYQYPIRWLREGEMCDIASGVGRCGGLLRCRGGYCINVLTGGLPTVVNASSLLDPPPEVVSQPSNTLPPENTEASIKPKPKRPPGGLPLKED